MKAIEGIKKKIVTDEEARPVAVQKADRAVQRTLQVV